MRILFKNIVLCENTIYFFWCISCFYSYYWASCTMTKFELAIKYIGPRDGTNVSFQTWCLTFRSKWGANSPPMLPPIPSYESNLNVWCHLQVSTCLPLISFDIAWNSEHRVAISVAQWHNHHTPNIQMKCISYKKNTSPFASKKVIVEFAINHFVLFLMSSLFYF